MHCAADNQRKRSCDRVESFEIRHILEYLYNAIPGHESTLANGKYSNDWEYVRVVGRRGQCLDMVEKHMHDTATHCNKLHRTDVGKGGEGAGALTVWSQVSWTVCA